MITSAFITLLQKEYPDWSRSKLLTYLNEIQLMVFTQNATNQMRMYDSSTGLDPVLTTDGTYEYSISTINGFSHDAWKVTAVYQTDITEPLDVLLFDGYYNTPAKVVFKSDPGTVDYYVTCFRAPTELTTEAVQLEIPIGYHLSHVYEGVVGLIENARNGKSDKFELFRMKLLPELVMKMSYTQSSFNVTPKGY